MDRLVAWLVLHFSVELSPGSMVAGVAVKLLMVAGCLTVTVAVAVADPAELVAVSV
jgi:type IV secretory pathway VirB3-like protein